MGIFFGCRHKKNKKGRFFLWKDAFILIAIVHTIDRQAPIVMINLSPLPSWARESQPCLEYLANNL